MNSKICPFCKKENSCATNDNTCWCMNEDIPRSLLELLPVNSVDKECICQSCIKLYKSDETNFWVNLDGKTE